MAERGPSKSELQDDLDQIGDMVEDALDPELTREQLVAKVKDISEFIFGEEEEDEEEEDDED